uniref:Ig-like domain-containing protein n=1 Tax=Leptobrachium leishanense TaxID=445787 RepID=A0A8C5M7P9_9ANUR
MKHPTKGLLCNTCLFLISFCVTGTHCFVNVVQTPASTFNLENSQTEIACVIKSRSIDQLMVFWYRKPTASDEPEFIVSSTARNKNAYNEDLRNRERFNTSRDHFQRSFILKITKLEYSDTGVYYCMVEEALKMAIGTGTTLNVVDKFPTVAPTLKTTTRMPCKCPEKKRKIKKGVYMRSRQFFRKHLTK